MGHRPKILVVFKHSRLSTFIKCLSNYADVVVKELGDKELISELRGGYDVLVTDISVPVDKGVIEAGLPELRVIGTFSLGVDHIDVGYALRRGIKVVHAATHTVGASTYAVAEHAFALLLTLLRKTHLYKDLARSGKQSWLYLSTSLSSPFVGKELFRKTLGVIGVGRIGSHTGRIGRGFGMRVVGYDPYSDPERCWEDGIELIKDLSEFLKLPDYLIITAPLDEETRGMITASEIELMKDGVYVVNVSRAALIDEEAMIKALREGKVSGYGTDVFLNEPPTPENSPVFREFLKGELNIVVTPHTAWLTEEAPERYARILARRIIEALTGKTLCESEFMSSPDTEVGKCPPDVVVSKGG